MHGNLALFLSLTRTDSLAIPVLAQLALIALLPN
jgi:hypothetical protein